MALAAWLDGELMARGPTAEPARLATDERFWARVRQALPIPTVPAMRASRAPSRRHIGGRAPRHFDRSPMLTIPICCPGLMRGTSVIIAGSIRGGLRDSGLGRGPAKMGAQFGMP